MQKAVRLSSALILSLALIAPSGAFAQEEGVFKNNETSISRDFFEQNFYYEGTSYLRLDRLYRKLFGKKAASKDVNVFDEVPDNTFFTNRHGRKTLSESDLAQGSNEGNGPDLSGPLTIRGGRFAEINTYLNVTDKAGSAYILKFDHADYLELGTGAEMIGNRFYHALGYNVPQTTLLNLEASQLVPGEGAKVVDGTGFNKNLTQEALDQYLMFVPQNDEGKYRVTAIKVFTGENKGSFKYHSRRRNDPNDPYDHEVRREIRALRVFSSWLNNTDLRSYNTADVLVDENGKKVLKHYLTDFDTSLGSDSYGGKPAHLSHEHFADFGETTKAFLGLGLWEKPWQKRWKEAGEQITSQQAGYFDNRYFSPEKFKTELPNYAFKDLTLADSFWAVKQMLTFKDSDIAALVKTGAFSDAANSDFITKTLIERRDLIAKHWLSTANPLDSFDTEGGKLVFEDLAVKYNFEKSALYHVTVISKEGKRGKPQASFTSSEPSVALDSAWGSQPDILIRVSRDGGKPGPYVRVEIADGKVTGITHQD